MKVALVGFGVENQSVYRYYQKSGISPTICDHNPDTKVPEGAMAILGDTYLDTINDFDIVVRSVGIHPSVITSQHPEVESKITTAVNLFFESCRTPIIGVTGTKGKGTTSTLIHKILEAAGKKALIAGNIGIPMLDVLDESTTADYVVLELSSFQLYDIKQSPHIALCLMVVPEHLNWHSDMQDYMKAKSNIFRYQNSDDVAIFNVLNAASAEIARPSAASTKLTYAVPGADEHVLSLCTTYVEGDTIFCRKQPIMKTSEVKLLGRHNLENICAAITATWDITGQNIAAIRQVAQTFAGLPFRLEPIRTLNGVTYFNDSFATTPETTIAALRAVSAPKVLIVGGSDKGIPFDDLANEITGQHVKTVLAIGQQGPIIAKLLQSRGYNNFIIEGLENMTKIVQKAQQIAEPGDAVLLSTACASFGMFKDYKDRGEQFNQAVQALNEAA